MKSDSVTLPEQKHRPTQTPNGTGNSEFNCCNETIRIQDRKIKISICHFMKIHFLTLWVHFAIHVMETILKKSL